MSKILIAFYSRADENYFAGRLKTTETGNTEIAANIISELTGGDLFKIEQIKPYSKGYNDCIAEAKEDQKKNARPQLKSYPKSIDEYDVVYLGYPNYWSTMPMAVWTFLEHFNFTGKTIRPFCTHEGSGLGNSIDDIKKLYSAKVGKGLALRGSDVQQSRDKIKKWIASE